MGNLGTVYCDDGRFAEARAFCERSLVLLREVGDRTLEEKFSGNLAGLLRDEGRLAEAKVLHERALALSREIGDRTGEAIALHNLGALLRDNGGGAGSEDWFLASLAICEEIGDRRVGSTTHLYLGSLRAASSDPERARGSLTAARDIAAASGFRGVETLARCELALLPGGDPADALAAFAEHGGRLSASERREARYLLWRATGDAAHLAEAKRLLDESVSWMSAEDRASALTNLRLNREVVEACKAEGL